MSRHEIERALARRMNLMSRAWQQIADQVLARLGVSSSTGWCLVYLDRLGADVRQADLARAVGIREPSLVRLLHQLEAAGLIERRTDPNDRRANHLLLTETGRTMAGRIEERLAEQRHILLADASSDDIEAALRVCEALANGIANHRPLP